MAETNSPLGKLPRFDYTHTKAQALASEETGTIFFTTDGFIVFNGEVWTKNEAVNITGNVDGNSTPVNYRQSDGSVLLPAYPTPTSVKGDAETNYRTGQVNITPANIGLGNVGNFKAVSTAANQGLSSSEKSNAKTNLDLGNVLNVAQIPASEKGANNGVATLDNNGKVPSSQLPSYVDDVVEGYMYDGRFYTSSQHTTEITGETGKVYVDVESGNNTTWRWSGSAFVQIKGDVTLGESSSTAYRGDRGKIAYDHASAKGSAFESGLYKITTNAEGHVTGATPVVKADITGFGIASTDQLNNIQYHHTPSTDNNETLDATTGGHPDYVIQKIKRDSKGHVTGFETAQVITSHQDISGKEDKSNKVTSVRAVASATDTAYPTEKAVATQLKAIQDQLDLLKWK